DEEIGHAAARRNAALARARDVLERPRRGRADRDDTAAFLARARDRVGGRGADLVAFGLDAVILDPLDADRLERAVADVQRDRRHADAAPAQRVEDRRSEVQTGRRGGNRSACLRAYRLVAVAGGGRAVAFGVWG